MYVSMCACRYSRTYEFNCVFEQLKIYIYIYMCVCKLTSISRGVVVLLLLWGAGGAFLIRRSPLVLTCTLQRIRSGKANPLSGLVSDLPCRDPLPLVSPRLQIELQPPQK